MKNISIGTLIGALLVPMLIGGISAALSSKAMILYKSMDKPALSPPAWIFPVVWTILYLMMGLASYFVLISEVNTRSKAMALIIYAIQLLMNFMWSILFFNLGMYLLSFIWLLIMWAITIVCAMRFYNISRTATYLLIPYILWLTFAAYLNFGSYLLNRK